MLLIVPVFPAHDKHFLQQLLTCVWGGRMFSQVSLSYVGFSSRLSQHGCLQGGVRSKLSAWPGDRGWLCLQQGALLLFPVQAGQICRQGLFQTALKWPWKSGTLGWAVLTYHCLSRHLVPQRSTRPKHHQLQPTVSARLCMPMRAARGCLKHVGLKLVPVWFMWMGCAVCSGRACS